MKKYLWIPACAGMGIGSDAYPTGGKWRYV